MCLYIHTFLYLFFVHLFGRGCRFDFCRNTIQSNGWSYHDNNTNTNINYQDKNVNGSNFWQQRPKINHYNFNEQQFRSSNTKSQRQPYHELDDHIRQASADYRIRITVNSDASATAAAVNRSVGNSKRSNPIPSREGNSSGSSSASIEVESESNESAASVTIVEIDDVHVATPHQSTPHQSNVDETVTEPHTRQQKQSAPPTTPPTQQHYNEKAIDVPAEFERRAYEYQRNELSPFVRNLQPNSQVK